MVDVTGEQGLLPPWAKFIYGHPFWCSGNTFTSKIAATVKVPPGVVRPPPPRPFATPLVDAKCYEIYVVIIIVVIFCIKYNGT